MVGLNVNKVQKYKFNRRLIFERRIKFEGDSCLVGYLARQFVYLNVTSPACLFETVSREGCVFYD